MLDTYDSSVYNRIWKHVLAKGDSLWIKYRFLTISCGGTQEHIQKNANIQNFYQQK